MLRAELVECEAEDYEGYFIEFTYNDDNVYFKFIGEVVNEYKVIADAIETSSNYILDFEQISGCCKIELTGAVITFTVDLVSDLGRMTVGVPAINTLMGFRMAHELVNSKK
jgi:hypothetical protein